LTEIRECYFRKQETGVEENEVEIDKFDLDIKLFQMTFKSLKIIHQVEWEKFPQNY
jgi:hypothetical protein